MGSCCQSKAVKGYVVKRPGQAPREVVSETAAKSLVQGHPGATYTPKGGESK